MSGVDGAAVGAERAMDRRRTATGPVYTYDPSPEEILDTIEAEVRGARGKYVDFRQGFSRAERVLREMDFALAYVVAKVDELRGKLP